MGVDYEAKAFYGFEVYPPDEDNAEEFLESLNYAEGEGYAYVGSAYSRGGTRYFVTLGDSYASFDLEYDTPIVKIDQKTPFSVEEWDERNPTVKRGEPAFWLAGYVF